MKCFVYIGIGALFLLPSAASSRTIYEVEKSGRNIQRDAFLLEWFDRDMRPFGRDSSLLWQVISTPEGLTGCMRGRVSDSCLPVAVTFSRAGDTANAAVLILDTVPRQNVFSTTYFSSENRTLSAEWILPWNTVASSGSHYEVYATGISACGSPVGSYVIRGEFVGRKKPVPPGLIAKGFLIAMLAAAYVLLRGRLRKRTPRKQ